MASITVCGANVTRRTAIIITVVGSVGIAVSCLMIILGFAIGCESYYDGYNYYGTDCSVLIILLITGAVLLSVTVTVAVCGFIMLYRMRNARVPMAMPVTLDYGQPYPQQSVGQLYPQQGTGQPYLQQGAGQFYSQGTSQFYSQGTSQLYQQQGVAPTYPQQAGVPPYPQQAGVPPYPQQAGVPPYLQQATAPLHPHQTTGLPHEQGPDQPYPLKSAYDEPTQLRSH
ncbi:AT-rich interactive domain-containing protein 1A-like [Penaeus chinensis]|uniref:AT-rich interactive domain-containing protein 1A-like n=1 Tax=Penaeus chinensis TaxID=139456 RepID=UPI001FB75029|nr:AT-rich interactive domain-containing protein 1A-like [Penaeus chinensis]XP_047495212.1 AT-rich interactive domain-containing protein 1A-like [Penaeus chinensis]